MRQHVFLINVHKDTAQTETLMRYLDVAVPDHNRLIYYDGPARWSAAPATKSVIAYEPDKCRSILKALSQLVEWACHAQAFTTASFLHADMIPTDWPQFWRFVERFRASGKRMTYSPIWPDKEEVDFCNLHFRLPEALEWFPVKGLPEEPHACFNERTFTEHLNRVDPSWRSKCYEMWDIVWPPTCAIMTAEGKGVSKFAEYAGVFWEYHNYVPESSVMHANDPAFWANYDKIARMR